MKKVILIIFSLIFLNFVSACMYDGPMPEYFSKNKEKIIQKCEQKGGEIENICGRNLICYKGDEKIDIKLMPWENKDIKSMSGNLFMDILKFIFLLALIRGIYKEHGIFKKSSSKPKLLMKYFVTIIILLGLYTYIILSNGIDDDYIFNDTKTSVDRFINYFITFLGFIIFIKFLITKIYKIFSTKNIKID